MKILIVDDHVLIRKGLKTLLLSYNPTWEVYESINGIQAIIQAPRIRPDIVLMDFSMPKLDGHKAARQLIRDLPGIKIIMISGFISSENIREMVDAGIMGLVSKSAGTEELLEAIYHVCNGKRHLTVESSLNSPEDKPKKKTGLLTPRELEVMRLLALGKRPDLVSKELAISKRTLEVHKTSIFKKCNIHTTAELVRYAYKNNLT
ncbi:MAG: response regulator transcription factor [bacterium]